MYQYVDNYKKNIIPRILFFSSLFLFLTLKYYEASCFVFKHNFNDQIDCLYKIISYILIFKIIFFNKKNSLIKCAIIILLCGAFYYSSINADVIWYKSIFTFLLFVLAAENFEVSEICKFISELSFLLIIIILVFYKIKILEDCIYLHGSRIRHSLGFTYTTYGPISLIAPVFNGIYYREKQKKKVSWIFIFLCLCMNMYFFIFTRTYLAFFTINIFVLFYVLFYKLKMRFSINKKLISYITVVSVIIFIMTIIITGKNYNDNNNVLKYINESLTHYRLMLNHEALNRYDINAWGQPINMSNGSDGHYFYIDSGYLHYLLQYGTIVFVIIMLCYFCIFIKSIEKSDYIISFWCLILFGYNIMNEFMISLDKCACMFLIMDSINSLNFNKYKLKNIITLQLERKV